MSHNWSSREEWAKHQRTVYYDMCENLVSTNLTDYASAEELDELVVALKALWLEEGRKMRAAKVTTGPLARQPDETELTYDCRIWGMKGAEKDLTAPWINARWARKEINQAIKGIKERRLRRFDEPRSQPAKDALALIVARYEAAYRAALNELHLNVQATPIDDAAWEKELQRRAEIERIHAYRNPPPANQECSSTENADRAAALALFADMAEADWSIIGATLTRPDGSVEYIDADLLRRGGWA